MAISEKRLKEACKIITRDIRKAAGDNADNLRNLLEDPYFRGKEAEKMMNEQRWYEDIASLFDLNDYIAIDKTSKGIQVNLCGYPADKEFIVKHFDFLLDNFKNITGYKLHY